MNDHTRQRDVLGTTHGLAYERLVKLLPGQTIKLVMIAEIEGDGVHIGFDPEDVPPDVLVTLLKDAAARLEEIRVTPLERSMRRTVVVRHEIERMIRDAREHGVSPEIAGGLASLDLLTRDWT